MNPVEHIIALWIKDHYNEPWNLISHSKKLENAYLTLVNENSILVEIERLTELINGFSIAKFAY